LILGAERFNGKYAQVLGIACPTDADTGSHSQSLDCRQDGTVEAASTLWHTANPTRQETLCAGFSIGADINPGRAF
jgi:hypothetical protein